MSSSDSNPVQDDAWARHYRVAAERRRARGWHRREDEGGPRSASARSAKSEGRVRTYVIAAVIFAALTLIALVIPR
jgi:hypothetical protein